VHFLWLPHVCNIADDVPVDMYNLRSDERMALGKVIICCINQSNKTHYIVKLPGAPNNSFVLVFVKGATNNLSPLNDS
jgi:hypothetical protein